MKKIIAALLAILTLLGLCSCTGFKNASYYVKMADYKDGSVIFVNQKDVTEKADESLKSFLESYPGIRDITTGKFVYDSDKGLPADFINGSYTVYIHYTSVLEMLNDTITIELGKSGVKGFDEALKKAEFKNGEVTITLGLGDITKDFKEAFKDVTPKDDTKPSTSTKPSEETSKETSSKPKAVAPVADDAEVAPAAETKPSTSTSTDKKEEEKTAHTFVVTLKKLNDSDISSFNGKFETLKAKDGDKLNMQIVWLVKDYDNYTEEDDKEKQEEADKKKEEEDKKNETSKEPSKEAEEEEEVLEKGYAYIMPSDPDAKLDKEDVISEDSSFPEGFAKELVGKDIVYNVALEAFTLTYPTTNSIQALRGKKITYTVTPLKVTTEYRRDIENAEQFEELKKDFLKDNKDGEFEYKDATELKAEFTSSATETLAIEAMMKACKMKHWPIDDLDEYYEMQYSYYYMMAMYGMTKMPSKEELYDIAGRALKQDLILYQIAVDQKLTKVTSEEILDFCGSEEQKDNMIESYGKNYVKRQTAINKAIEWLGENVEVKDAK